MERAIVLTSGRSTWRQRCSFKHTVKQCLVSNISQIQKWERLGEKKNIFKCSLKKWATVNSSFFFKIFCPTLHSGVLSRNLGVLQHPCSNVETPLHHDPLGFWGMIDPKNMPVPRLLITLNLVTPRNDLYCVEWDVKLYYTIPYHWSLHVRTVCATYASVKLKGWTVKSLLDIEM